jgi:AraC family transcriptional regulator of adaptative response / DNA-3-methyladenine glycosylase II
VRADLAARALRGIETGIVDSDGVPGLARRLAVSERHLHRILVREVGAGALALARTRRAQTARMLIEHTQLPLGTVAFSAGFASIRQFNDVMRAEFGAAPSELRRRPAAPGDATGTLTLRLALRPPYDAAAVYRWLAARALPGVEEGGTDVYRRVLGNGTVEVSGDGSCGYLVVRLSVDDVQSVAGLVARLRRLFDLDADPAAVDDVLGKDPLLAASVRRHPGIRVPGSADGFELAVRAVLGQQVSVAAARTFGGRLATAYGTPLAAVVGSLTHAFPTAQQVAEADLGAVGLTRARMTTLHALARAVADRDLVLDGTADRDEARRRLLALPGVGPWTADYIAMRALGDPDAFPASDLVLRRALAQQPARQPECWRPWRAYAAMHLWTMATEET